MTDDSRAHALAARRTRAPRAAFVASLVGALLLGACATGRSVQQSVGDLADRVSGRSAQGEPRVFYALARTKVYSEPDADSSVLGVLDRYEKIARYQSESGFAYVEAEGKLSGWVRESQLTLERPQARKPAAAEPAQPAEGEPAQSTAVTPAPGTSAETEASPAPATEAPTETPPPDSGSEPLEPERSVFDPY